jgi:dTDP-4-amino-4,6-dideoxygalactose transaminase
LLAPLAERGQIGVPFEPQHCATNHHMFYVLAADLDERTALVAHLRQAGILAVFHYVPLHSSPFARSLGVPQASLRVTEDASARLLRLPMYYDLSDREVGEVADRITEFYDRRASGSPNGRATRKILGMVTPQQDA